MLVAVVVLLLLLLAVGRESVGAVYWPGGRASGCEVAKLLGDCWLFAGGAVAAGAEGDAAAAAAAAAVAVVA